jgi:RimJ/RimL family protein N-acetyltransferase
LMAWAINRYNLRRLSVNVPPYQSGTIRFIRRLGFKLEGEKRCGIIHKGTWFPLLMYGILREEAEQKLNEQAPAALVGEEA